MQAGEHIRLFANGEEYRTWGLNNCRRCVKRWPGDGPALCDIEEAISSACVLDGTVAPEIATRAGYTGNPEFWCKEYQSEGTPEPKPAAREMEAAGATCLPGFDFPRVGQPAGGAGQ